MSRADSNRDDDTDNEGMDVDIFRLTRQAYTHLLVGLLVLFVAFGGFGAGVFTLGKLIKSADELLAIEPENRAETFSKQIAATHARVERQYGEYLARMDDESIYAVSDKFAEMYQLSKESERDYTQTLASYQQASYQIASKIRGSGEWYRYYEKELTAYLQRQRSREQKLAAYLSEN